MGKLRISRVKLLPGYQSTQSESDTFLDVKYKRRMKDVHYFYHELSKVVRTLNTIRKTKKPDKGEGHMYSILNKLGPVRGLLALKDQN